MLAELEDKYYKIKFNSLNVKFKTKKLVIKLAFYNN